MSDHPPQISKIWAFAWEKQAGISSLFGVANCTTVAEIRMIRQMVFPKSTGTSKYKNSK